jgi:hypothetical protein
MPEEEVGVCMDQRRLFNLEELSRSFGPGKYGKR